MFQLLRITMTSKLNFNDRLIALVSVRGWHPNMQTSVNISYGGPVMQVFVIQNTTREVSALNLLSRLRVNESPGERETRGEMLV